MKKYFIAFVALGIMCMWGLVIYMAFVSATPRSPLSPSPASMFNTTLLVPEGWAFFTRNPREPDVVLYKKVNGQWLHDPINPLSMSSNYWGLDRRPRAQSTEVAMILSSVPQDLWVSSDSSVESCLTNFFDSSILQINNIVPEPVLCDTVAIQLLPPVPWAWSKNKKLIMPYRLVCIKVNCK